MVAYLLILALSGEPIAPEGALRSAPEDPLCKEIWEQLWEFQEYTELTDAEIREITNTCVEWAEGGEG